MKIVTRQDLANTAAKRWKGQYFDGYEWFDVHMGDSEDVYKALSALGENPNPDDVDNVIGNDSWTQPLPCSECGKRDGSPVIEIGEELDIESHTAWLCRECVGHAGRIIGGYK